MWHCHETTDIATSNFEDILVSSLVQIGKHQNLRASTCFSVGFEKITSATYIPFYNLANFETEMMCVGSTCDMPWRFPDSSLYDHVSCRPGIACRVTLYAAAGIIVSIRRPTISTCFGNQLRTAWIQMSIYVSTQTCSFCNGN